MKNNIIIIDTETSGLNPNSELIVEVAAIKLDCKSFKYQKIFNSLCNPRLSKKRLEKSWICSNGFISPEEILKAPNDIKVASELKLVLGNSHWTTFNLEFDGGFLSRNPWKLKKRNEKCIMKSATHVCNIPHPYYVIKYPSLDEAYQILVKKQSNNNHRALDDAIMATEVLIYLIKNGHYK